jgi:hypothetical protein
MLEGSHFISHPAGLEFAAGTGPAVGVPSDGG